MLKFLCDHCGRQIEDFAGEHCYSDNKSRVLYYICPHCGTQVFCVSGENRELLASDLAARLTYGVKVDIWSEEDDKYYLGTLVKIHTNEIKDTYTVVNDARNIAERIEFCVPYLRPIKSMTEEEERELNVLLPEIFDFTFKLEELLEEVRSQKSFPYRFIDWLNAHHFDYRGLIDKNLAKVAPDDMYK